MLALGRGKMNSITFLDYLGKFSGMDGPDRYFHV